jgi:fatty acyl-CoA reductase
VAQLASGCPRLRSYVHVSTAYVHGSRQGVAEEALFAPGVSIAQEQGAGVERLDVDAELLIAMGERGLVERGRGGEGDKQQQQQQQQQEGHGSDAQQRQLGLTRAAHMGWPNTYSLTKALGEVLAVSEAQARRLPLAIVRPSIVESCRREPLPGWMEGLRMADPLVVAYGKGQIGALLLRCLGARGR